MRNESPVYTPSRQVEEMAKRRRDAMRYRADWRSAFAEVALSPTMWMFFGLLSLVVSAAK